MIKMPKTEEEILVWALGHQSNGTTVSRDMFREITGYSVALTIADRNLEYRIVSLLDDWVLQLQCNKSISKNIIVRNGNTFILGLNSTVLKSRHFDSVSVANILLF